MENQNLQVSQSSNSTIIIRLSTLLFIGIISIWVNFAASTPFQITIFNHIQHIPARNRFHIFYISDDKAVRVIQNTSSFIQNILYHHPNINKHTHHVKHLTLRLQIAATAGFTATKDGNFHELLINLTAPQIMGDLKMLDYAFKSMVLEGMARIWLSSSSESRAPPWIVDGVVEYIKMVAGYSGSEISISGGDDFWLGDDDNIKDKEARVVAQFLQHCESIREGFIQRLMIQGWDDPTVDNALRFPIRNVCDNITYISYQHSSN